MKYKILILLMLFLASGCSVQECDIFSVDNCPESCVVCPPCIECSSISCQTEEFCLNLGFSKEWYESVTKPPLDKSVVMEEEIISEPETTNETEPIVEEEPPTKKIEDKPPVIYDFGITIKPLDRRNMAGDLDFDAISYSDKIFLEFGADEGDGSLNPHPMFVLPLGTEIHAVSDGIVYWTKSLNDNDYDICVYRYEGDEWCVSYEHIMNPRVKKGDIVKVGDVIGEAGSINQYTEFGKFDLKVWKGGRTIIDYCPYSLFHDSVKEENLDRLQNLLDEWEGYVGKDVYGDMVVAGCILETVEE